MTMTRFPGWASARQSEGPGALDIEWPAASPGQAEIVIISKSGAGHGRLLLPQEQALRAGAELCRPLVADLALILPGLGDEGLTDKELAALKRLRKFTEGRS
jgi:hypothetical protein